MDRSRLPRRRPSNGGWGARTTSTRADRGYRLPGRWGLCLGVALIVLSSVGPHVAIARAAEETVAPADRTVVRSPATAQVQARDNVFDPEQIHVDPGDSVRWENVGFRIHTVTSDDGAFDSGDMSTGDAFTQTFPDEGLFFYHCRHHGSPRSGMWGVVVVGDPPPLNGARTKIVVPDDVATIKRAVDRAEPHSTILVRPGTYLESVVVRVPDLVIRGVDRFTTVLDGGDTKAIGIAVEGFGDVTIRDLTIRNYLASGIALEDVTDYAIERVDLIKDRTVGIEVVGSYDGLIQDVFVWGSGDSGIRIAECFACSTVVRSSQARWSYLGLSAVNVTGVVVSDSRFVHNGVGIAAIGTAERPFASGGGIAILDNVVRDNDYASVPAAGLSETSGIPFGTGIWIAGTANATSSGNVVEGHDRYGILVSRSIDRLADPVGAVVVANAIDGDGGLDLAWDGTGRDDCFDANIFQGSTGPPNIETRYACSARPFEGVLYAPVFDDVEDALALDPNRPQEEPPEPDRPPCQRGHPDCP